MASTSRHAFEEVVPSASISGRSTMPVKKLPYDVFINHRGPDVKHTLAATLYNTLTGMGLRIFLDSEELELGDFLPTEIQEAMHGAPFHIAIFSENYAQSPWCLAELSFMLKTGAQIVPIFYHVQPEDVRYAKGVYADAFDRHKKKGRYSSDKLQEWKNTLNTVSFNVGHIVNNKGDEGRMLKDIGSCVLKVIKNVPFVVAKHPVGLDEIILDFEKTIPQFVEGHSTVQTVGIWGMGGSGKTTLAKQLYNSKYRNMERSSFVLDIRDAASKKVLHTKQKKLIEDIGLPDVSVDDLETGKGILANRLRSIRALIVLDDVDAVDQLDALVPEKDSLGRGSLIVVTTREREVLLGWGISFSFIYKMKALYSPHAKQLFCWHAFLQPSPIFEFEDLVENFLNVCKGLPLSLKVFGAQLYGISDKDYWESQLHKISRVLDKNIKEKLKVSYDVLDEEEKQIFLDCACSFIGEEKTSAIAAWDKLGLSGLHSWQRLLNKCLVELDDQNCIRMHDHLRDLGREIANQKCSPQHIVNVDNEAQGIAIQGIMDTTAGSTSEVDFPQCSQDGVLIVNTSKGDCGLTANLLGFKNFQVTGSDYNQAIRWVDHGHKNLYSLGSLKNLRVLELNEKEGQEKHLEQLWETDSDAPVHLRQLVISGCSKFQGFPKSIGCLINLKKIVMQRSGESMKSLPESFCLLQSLEHLELLGCYKLSSLPNNFGDLRNLRHLLFDSCSNLMVLPNSFKKLTLLQHLYVSFCSKLTIDPELLENMTNIEALRLAHCNLKEFPRHITKMASLRYLNLDFTFIREIPMSISQLRKLQIFSFGSESLTSVPTSLVDLLSLTTLSINGCSNLESLPESIGRLNLLKSLKINYSGLKSLPKSLRQLSNLQSLEIDMCPINNLDLNSSPGELDLNSSPGELGLNSETPCTALRKLRVDTRWEEAGIQTLEKMERLRSLHLMAISRSAIEGCIESIQKWPEEMIICTRAVPESGSRIDSIAFPNLSVVDFFSNKRIESEPSLEWSSSSDPHCILLCFVLDCNSPIKSLYMSGDDEEIHDMELDKGKWVLLCVFTQSSNWHTANKFVIKDYSSDSDREGEVERGMLVVVEQEKVGEAFHGLWKLLSD
ncbi:hypothetical protein SUGI_0734090 [Cryptomeria japonica]|nr:hypothetical protein SUGI_0734090 [Cryptomeria japonica]